MAGGGRHVKVSNCTFSGTDVGLRFKSARGRGGVVENIWIEDIAMNDILQEPLLFDLFYGGKSASEALAENGGAEAADLARRRDHAGLPGHPYPKCVVPRRAARDVFQRTSGDERRARHGREHADLRRDGRADQRVFGCRAARRADRPRAGSRNRSIEVSSPQITGANASLPKGAAQYVAIK